MKKFLLASATLVLGAGGAFAADMPAKAPAYNPPPAFSWSGFYLGAHAGYGSGRYHAIDGFSAPSDPGSVDTSGAFGGVQIGYNRQLSPQWLLGTEIDLSAGDIKGSGISSTFAFPTHASVDYFGTARTRLGYVMDRSLLYLTGGVAWAHNRYSRANFMVPVQFNVGWTAGGGYEYAIDQHWSAKVEYLYADFGRNKNTQPISDDRVTEPRLHMIRVGLNYRWGDPVASVSRLPVKTAPVSDPWAGAYVGAHGGYVWGRWHVEDFAHGAPFAWTHDLNGGFGGFQTGYNWRVAPDWIVGLEADTSFLSISRQGTTLAGALVLPVQSKLDGLSTVRGRLGYTFDRSMVYATAGFAWAHVKFQEFTVLATPMWGGNEYHLGWTVGGGYEYAFNADWSAKLEYLYADLGHRTDRQFALERTELTASTVKLGLNYHGPIIERFFGGR